jgi:effector-binding domain-containing protein
VDDLRSFQRWSPWARRDSKMQTSYTGPEQGVGQKMSWKGDPSTVGEGTQEITRLVPCALVETSLDFGEQEPSRATFRLEPLPDGRTRITWSLDTDMGAGPIGRYFGLMMEGWIGADYDEGLALLKREVERHPEADIGKLDVSEVHLDPTAIAYLSITATTPEPAAVARQMEAAFGEINNYASAQGLALSGRRAVLTQSNSLAGLELDAAMPLVAAPTKDPPADSRVKIGQLPEGKTAHFIFEGRYAQLPEAHKQMNAWLSIHSKERNMGPVVEIYDATTGPEAGRVLVYYPVK